MTIINENPVLSEQYINEGAPYPSCHASTIAEAADGTLVAAWFGGTRERDPDVGIWVSRMDKGKWLPAVEVANGLQADGTRFPTWNPVLFQPPVGDLHLFYKVGPNPREWWGMVMTSPDGGKTWSAAERLPEGIIGPVKNKPVTLPDGTWVSPSSTEDLQDGWNAHLEVSHDQGQTWQIVGPIARGVGLDAIQPSVLLHGDGVLEILCRTKQGTIGMAWSYDGGVTWTEMA
ncbi:MAG TPA: sialidase family protein, partial [Oceanipulchritudo sp.]|nr:sialidase family protein [Oceanipulchritudo sp.]